MTKLNQIVALEKGLKGRTTNAITEIHRTLGRSGQFNGFHRNYLPKDEEGEQLPAEGQIVQATVKQQLDAASELLTRLFDVVAVKEWGNMHATAHVRLGERVLVENAPVPYLLFLEKMLTDWRTLVTNLPLLDPAQVWEYDADNGCYRTAPSLTNRSKKVPRVLQLAPATDRHPAQVQTYNEDIPVGIWHRTEFSGGVPARTRDELVSRANELIDAVKSAREEANGAEVEQKEIADPLFEYLLGPL